MVKAIPASQVHDVETEKSQNHHPHPANGEKNDCDNMVIDVFRWSRCKKPLPQKVMRSVGIPLPLEHVEVTLISNFLFCFLSLSLSLSLIYTPGITLISNITLLNKFLLD